MVDNGEIRVIFERTVPAEQVDAIPEKKGADP
jgi:hypothetical protein